MTRMRWLGVVLVLCGLWVGLSSCSSDDGGSGGTSAPATSEPSETTSAPSGAVDLLYIQDSGGMFGAPELYAERIEATLGLPVTLHDKTRGGLSATTVLERMRSDLPTGWDDLVRDAEFIVAWGNPVGSGARGGYETCIFARSPSEPLAPFTDADWQPYQEVLEQVFAEIWAIREGEPVVLRTLGWPVQNISGQREAGIEEVCAESTQTLNDAIRDAAAVGGATFVSMYDLFNGPGHDEDPVENGLIGSDLLHPTEEGSAAIADALAAAGFEPNTPPSDSAEAETTVTD